VSEPRAVQEVFNSLPRRARSLEGVSDGGLDRVARLLKKILPLNRFGQSL